MNALRVLIIEDDALIGIYLAEMLAEMGYDVCAIATTEADAVTAAVQHGPGLMIVDVNLRDGSGIAAVDQIFRTSPLPCVFISGDISSVEAVRPGSVVVQKPFREHELARAIQRALSVAAET
jgi:two-component system, response regulator PdtaR